MKVSYNGLWKVLIDKNMNKKDYVPLEESNLKRFNNGMSVKVPPEIKQAQKKAHN